MDIVKREGVIGRATSRSPLVQGGKVQAFESGSKCTTSDSLSRVTGSGSDKDSDRVLGSYSAATHGDIRLLKCSRPPIARYRRFGYARHVFGTVRTDLVDFMFQRSGTAMIFFWGETGFTNSLRID